MEEYPSMSDCLDWLRTGTARMAFASWTCMTIRYWLPRLDFTGNWPVFCGNFPVGVMDVDCLDDNIVGLGTRLGECPHFCWFRRGVLGALVVLLDYFLVAFGGGGQLQEVLLD